jgi:hypothetical protein
MIERLVFRIVMITRTSRYEVMCERSGRSISSDSGGLVSMMLNKELWALCLLAGCTSASCSGTGFAA